MAFTVASSISAVASSIAPTGRPTQGHVQYAVNQGAYWIFYLSGTQSLSALYSTNNGITWNTPSGSPFTLASIHNGEGRNFGFCYADISSIDILHMYSSYYGPTTPSTNNEGEASRFTLGATWTNTNTEVNFFVNRTAPLTPEAPSGGTVALDSNNLPHYNDPFSFGGNLGSCRAINIDNGFSWSGLGAFTNSSWGGGSQVCQSTATIPFASAKMMNIGDNENGYNPASFTQLQDSIYNAGWGAAGTVLSTTITAVDDNAWGACARTPSEIHAIALSDNNSNYVHRIFNGTSWANGNTITSLSYSANSGISLVSDGISVWAAIIDSLNNIQVNQWVPSGGWKGWNVQEIRTNAASYITGVRNGSQIMWVWSEVNGSNFDIIGTTYSIVYQISTSGVPTNLNEIYNTPLYSGGVVLPINSMNAMPPIGHPGPGLPGLAILNNSYPNSIWRDNPTNELPNTRLRLVPQTNRVQLSQPNDIPSHNPNYFIDKINTNQLFPSIDSMSGGVLQQFSNTGQIGRPGPGLPGLSRFHAAQNLELMIANSDRLINTRYLTGPISKDLLSNIIIIQPSYEEIDIIRGLFSSIRSGGGVRLRAGSGSIGQIGRPGPGLPGLSRFWQSYIVDLQSVPLSTTDTPFSVDMGTFNETGYDPIIDIGLVETVTIFDETGFGSIYDQSTVFGHGTFSETGNTITTNIGLVEIVTIFSETGNAVTINIGLVETVTIFSETGNAVITNIGLVETVTTFSETGFDSIYDQSTTFGHGTFSETGNAVTTNIGLVETVTTFSETGSAVTINIGLVEIVTTFSETGNAVTTNIGLVETVTTFSETGYDVNFYEGLIIITVSGSFNEVGYTPIFDISIIENVTIFSETGNILIFDQSTAFGYGAFSETGYIPIFDIGLIETVTLFNETGNSIITNINLIETVTIFSESPGTSYLDQSTAFGFGIFSETGHTITISIDLIETVTTFSETGYSGIFDQSGSFNHGTFNETSNTSVLDINLIENVTIFNETGLNVIYNQSSVTDYGIYIETGYGIILASTTGSHILINDTVSYIINNLIYTILDINLIDITATYIETYYSLVSGITGECGVFILSDTVPIIIPYVPDSSIGIFTETGYSTVNDLSFSCLTGSFSESENILTLGLLGETGIYQFNDEDRLFFRKDTFNWDSGVFNETGYPVNMDLDAFCLSGSFSENGNNLTLGLFAEGQTFNAIGY